MNNYSNSLSLQFVLCIFTTHYTVDYYKHEIYDWPYLHVYSVMNILFFLFSKTVKEIYNLWQSISVQNCSNSACVFMIT